MTRRCCTSPCRDRGSTTKGDEVSNEETIKRAFVEILQEQHAQGMDAKACVNAVLVLLRDAVREWIDADRPEPVK